MFPDLDRRANALDSAPESAACAHGALGASTSGGGAT